LVLSNVDNISCSVHSAVGNVRPACSGASAWPSSAVVLEAPPMHSLVRSLAEYSSTLNFRTLSFFLFHFLSASPKMILFCRFGEYLLAVGFRPYTSASSCLKLAAFPQQRNTYSKPMTRASSANLWMSLGFKHSCSSPASKGCDLQKQICAIMLSLT